MDIKYDKIGGNLLGRKYNGLVHLFLHPSIVLVSLLTLFMIFYENEGKDLWHSS